MQIILITEFLIDSVYLSVILHFFKSGLEISVHRFWSSTHVRDVYDVISRKYPYSTTKQIKTRCHSLLKKYSILYPPFYTVHVYYPASYIRCNFIHFHLSSACKRSLTLIICHQLVHYLSTRNANTITWNK